QSFKKSACRQRERVGAASGSFTRRSVEAVAARVVVHKRRTGPCRRWTRHIHSRDTQGERLKRRRALAIVLGVFALTSRVGPSTTLAAAPDVREISPAGITIDGSATDWDELAADFVSDMFEAGKPDKDVLSKLYGRYDCSTGTFYVLVQTVPHWHILPSNNDNYVKLGETDKWVDGSDGHDGAPPDFAYIGSTGWEAAFHLAPGSYLGDNGLNVHAQVVPDARPSTSAVANRRLDVTIDCSAPTPTPTPTPTTTPP